MAILNEGAKDARNEIKKFHSVLNQRNLVPDQCYRRNNQYFRLVTYVNHTVGLFLSSNYDVIPTFLNRAFFELQRLNSQPIATQYEKVAYDYLCQVAYFVQKFPAVDDFAISQIPDELLSAGPRNAPDMDHQTLEFK